MGNEGRDSPTPFVAVTVKVYDVPATRPVTVATLSPGIVTVTVTPSGATVTPSGAAVTAYPVMGDPPSEGGASQMTTASLLPATATTLIGASGTVTGAVGVTGSLGKD
ncbi:MAG: hypothetical protein QOF35_1035, partial [Actinomycetota bacterium]|nr:hypothetical protein [Actinomycetota bacterium]